MMWDLWWVWMAGAVALGILELFAPGFVFVGFAIGAAVVGVLLALGVTTTLPWLLVIFAVVSVIAWVVMRQLFMLSGDRLVCILRDDIPDIVWPDHWDIPGGGREGDEPPEACVLRETFEEVGLRLTPDRLVWRRRYIGGTPGGSWFFAVELTEQEVTGLRLGNEGQRLCLMPLAEFLQHPKAVPHFRDRLRDYLKVRAG